MLTPTWRQPIMYTAERHFHKRRLFDFLTNRLSHVHVITPDDLIGTPDTPLLLAL